MRLSRRDLIKLGVGTGAGALLARVPLLHAQQTQTLIRKPIPASGELLPVVGLGSSQTFNLARGDAEWATAREVVRLFHQLGGKVIDTSPTYQRSETFVGEAVRDFRIQDELFLATKVNVGPQGKPAAIEQMEESSRRFGKRSIDLMQVWNLGDSIRNLTDTYLDAHMEIANEWKRLGRARYIGITTSRDQQYADVEAAMRRHRVDFVQLDYSIGDRIPEQRLLPLARERNIAVIVNRPFTAGNAAGNLFRLVSGKQVPEWAKEFDCTSWAQFFLKYIVSHPSVTCAIPATGDAAHLRDNMGACVGRLPDAGMRQRMAQHFDSL